MNHKLIHEVRCDSRDLSSSKHRDRCPCGWTGPWLSSAGLAHSSYDAHLEDSTPDLAACYQSSGERNTLP